MDHHTVRKKANTYFFSKVAVNALLVILGAVLISFFLRQMQHQTSLYKQQQNSRASLLEAVELLSQNIRDAEELTVAFHDSNQDILCDLSDLLSNGLFDMLIPLDAQSRSEVFADVVERAGMDYLLLMDDKGTVLLSSFPEYYQADLVDCGLLSPESLAMLVEGTKHDDGSLTPAVEQLDDGEYCFYSQRFQYGSTDFNLILGVSNATLKAQLSSLLDVSVVLERASVSNGGFLFAVDKESGVFLYYKNGEEVLTGQNALEAGFTELAMHDGYAGLQTINGVRYYCVSKTLGSSTVVCAVASRDGIFKNDEYVLFWSISGFVLVMLLCLVYAVIVRNDFVRRAVSTDKKIFHTKSGHTVIFDRSIFRKTFPLMALGVLVIFFISFYTQTLLEISQSIESSVVALNDASARYEESQRTRDIVQTYYDQHFLSKARLLAYLIEEDPSVLNEQTDRSYSELDMDGMRVFLEDEQGNRLRSVSRSAYLQKLCDQNELGAIYLINENGRTIATNTDLWYFTLSPQPGDQSYPFLSILEGKNDSLVQVPMVSDFGVSGQFIGVAFNYYTTLNEQGETVYVSRRAFLGEEQPVVENEDGEEELLRHRSAITEHRGLLQIAIDQELSARLLASTELDYVFSASLLNGGYIMLFDATEEHWCLYSPTPAQIEMSAAELGIPANAFTGNDYYGFSRLNGEVCFQYFRYGNGNFICTCVPRSGMYPARAAIALTTSLASLLLILILSATVTLTTEEEELLYASMSERESKRGLDSAIFDVILPSGKSVSTVKAAARWDNSRIPWRERNPEQKLILLINCVGGVLVFYLLIAIIGIKTFFGDSSIISYILSGAWEKSPNIFALSACALVLIFTSIAIALLRIPVRIITSLLGARSETIGHLLISVTKYGGAIGAFFYCLYLIGIDSTSLLASASILSLVVGLGAQSLIKDIIAGIFIVFEGEFRVGDIITIDGFRGTVMDIGLRTTKILAFDGNIKIFNNSDISGVLNMTKEASILFSTFSIEYGQDLGYVEAVLKRELPKLRERNKMILDGPQYLGVNNLGESSVDLLVMTKSSEQDLAYVRRFLNQAVLQIFYDYDINVPFPNVTVSQLDMTTRKTAADLEQDGAEEQ